MAFLEVEFPRVVAFKSAGGPGFSTTVNTGLSGQESRNQNWAYSRGKWKIGAITPQQLDRTRQKFVDALIAFFNNCAGKANSFRFFDHADNRAVAQPLVAVTGGVQLAVTRQVGSASYVQLISKPIAASASTGFGDGGFGDTGFGDGSTTVQPVDYLGHALPNTVFKTGTQTPVIVDPTTGLVLDGTAAGTLVDFQFDYPVRFDVDQLELTVEPSAVNGRGPVVSLNSVPLIEVLPPNF